MCKQASSYSNTKKIPKSVIMMLDTVNFKLTQEEVEGVSFLEELPQYLEADSLGVHDYNGMPVVTGNLEVLKVSVNRFQVKIGNGSLCKYLLGDNFQCMGRADIKQAVEKISDTLHLPMNLASVTRLDVADNIIVKHPVSVYLNHLGMMKGHSRLQQPDSVYYTGKESTLLFYNKVKEQRAKREPIPELFSDANVLRYEQRYTHKLESALHVPKVTGALLYDEKFYIDMLNRWREAYQSISKINEIVLNFQAMTTKQQMYKMGVLSMVERVGGELAMLNQIADAQKRGELTTKQAYDLRQAVKDACKIREGLTIQSEAITELDRKIAQAIRFYR